MKKLLSTKPLLLILLITFVSVAVISTSLIILAGKSDDSTTSTLQSQNGNRYGATEESDSTTSNTANVTTEATIEADYETVESLQYLIEEEKLAHDVYVYFYDMYGAKIFNNIGASESTHQDKVLELLVARDIPDPRLEDAGKYSNQELQDLYDQLIKQGEKSVTEAYKVGVAIEEKDIADLQAEIDKTDDEDIKLALINLREASERHLASFNRQL